MRIVVPGDSEKLSKFYLDNREHFSCWEPTSFVDLSLVMNAKKFIDKWIKEFNASTAIRFFVFLKGEEEKIIAVVNFSQISRGSFQACYLGFKVKAVDLCVNLLRWQ